MHAGPAVLLWNVGVHQSGGGPYGTFGCSWLCVQIHWNVLAGLDASGCAWIDILAIIRAAHRG